MRAHGKGAAPWPPFILAFVAELIMAWVLAGVIWPPRRRHASKNGVISGAFCWLGFVITTMAVNNTFGMRSPR